METDELKAMILVITSPESPKESREAYCNCLKYYSMAYITALQGVAEFLLESDPIHQCVTQALSEIETVLMDR